MIILKKASLEKRKKIYQWLYFSDFSEFLNKIQGYPPQNIPSCSEFEKDYENFYFEDSNPIKGRGFMILLKNPGKNQEEEKEGKQEEIGFISYTSFHLNDHMAEIDIWLKSLKYTGKGYGTRAINILSDILFEKGFNTLIIRPSIKNTPAIRSYKKAGFIEEELDPAVYYKKEFIAKYSEGDYGPGQDVFMVRKKPM